jgi:hypothetical protein
MNCSSIGPQRSIQPQNIDNSFIGILLIVLAQKVLVARKAGHYAKSPPAYQLVFKLPFSPF